MINKILEVYAENNDFILNKIKHYLSKSKRRNWDKDDVYSVLIDAVLNSNDERLVEILDIIDRGKFLQWMNRSIYLTVISNNSRLNYKTKLESNSISIDKFVDNDKDN